MGHEAYASSTAKPEAPNRDRPEGGGSPPGQRITQLSGLLCQMSISSLTMSSHEAPQASMRRNERCNFFCASARLSCR